MDKKRNQLARNGQANSDFKSNNNNKGKKATTIKTSEISSSPSLTQHFLRFFFFRFRCFKQTISKTSP